MAENTAVKNESKEAQLAKASRMNMIRSILPVVGLVGIFLLFNILTGGGMVKSLLAHAPMAQPAIFMYSSEPALTKLRFLPSEHSPYSRASADLLTAVCK